MLSAIGTALVISQFRFLRHEPGGQTEAFLHAIFSALNPGENPVIPPAQEALPDGVDVAMILFGTGSIVSMFATSFVILGRGYLDRQCKYNAHMNRQFRLLLKCLTVMLLIALTLLVCGLGQQMWCTNSSVAYALAPLAVPGVGMSLWMAAAVLSV